MWPTRFRVTSETHPASNTRCILLDPTNANDSAELGRTVVFTGVTPGTNRFELEVSVSDAAATLTVAHSELLAQPLN